MASLSKKFFASSLWFITLGCFLISEVNLYPENGEVWLKVLLTRFSNPGNRNALSQCCDGKKNAPICTDHCDIYFAVCAHRTAWCKKSKIFLRNGSEFVASQRNLSASSENMDRTFVSMFLKVDPMFFNDFSVHLYDDDSQGNQSLNEKIIDYTENLPTPLKSLSYHRNISRNNIFFAFVYSLHFSCKKYFYGDRCVTHCRPRNNIYGHYKCLPNGTSVCLPGWKGGDCTEPICPGGCKNNGICKKPYSCSCDTDFWTGPTCEKCVPDHQCLHATCTSPKNCICKKNWTGTYCNVYKDYCSRYHPCKNGRCKNDPAKNYTCSCNSGWTGDKCDKFLCSSSCNLTNAVCTKRGNCSCNAGWTGTNCNQCIPTSNCAHGDCNRPFECLCEKGWSGENCTEPVIKSICSQQNPCKNDGECVDVDAEDFHCVCKQGFTGRHCKDKVSDLCSTPCNQSNGACHDNECRCLPGWQGPSCSVCVRNSSCVNGFCRRPFECICHVNWTGSTCNISQNNTDECTSDGERSSCGRVQQIGSNEPVSDYDRLIYILSSVLVLLILLSLVFIAWRLRRRRATFDVPSSSSRVNAWDNEKPSYIVANGNSEGQELSLNNNNSVSQKRTSPEILLNPMALQPSQNSRSMLLKHEPEKYEGNDIINNEDSSPDSSEYRII